MKNRVLISGATGLIGTKLIDSCLESGFEVNYLSRNPDRSQDKNGVRGYFWNPGNNEIDTDCFSGVSVIINLAGAPIAKRWTASYKQSILNSRVDSIRVLKNAIEKHKVSVQQFISASAIGYYPDSETEYYDESFQTDKQDFIIDVVRQWELAADEISDLKIPVAKVRIGLVLSNNGGALPKIADPIKKFVGSCLGSGKQWQSWIHEDDVVGIFMHVLNNRLEGVFNAVAPNPVTHKVLVRQIAKTLGRPLILPNVPTAVLKLMLGDMHTIITNGQRVSSKRIEDTGYEFSYHQLGSALQDLLKA